MKKQSIIYILIATIFFIIISCEKDITVDLPRPAEKITVEGFIELDDYPVVFLTKNLAYFDLIDSTLVKNTIIKDNQALVIVSNNGVSDTLNSVVLNRWPYFAYQGTKFTGQIGESYDLKIIYEENEYLATTKIRDTVAIDSVNFEILEGNDSLTFISVTWKDKPEIGNYYTVTVKQEGKDNWFYRPYFGIHLVDDKLDNNNSITYAPIFRGFERNDYYNDFEDLNAEDQESDFLSELFYKLGDTISVKLSTIDDNAYNFWSSWYRNMITDGNPFANPAKVKTNITGAPANGYWIGRGSYVTTFYIADSTVVYL
ncbi:MAG: DUF4249 domain-containing protein [Bacteroidales bacterium]|nr:DUF4249 domain-containing protein [Bacteroidales bacterium]